MSADEYRAALDALSYSQEGWARVVGASPRTGQKWALGEARVPGAVVILLRLLLSRPELRTVLGEMTPPPTRTRRAADSA